MGRWITFDHESTTAIAAVTTATPELHDAKPGANQDALGAALACKRDAVLLIAAADSEQVIVAHIRHVPPPAPCDIAHQGMMTSSTPVEAASPPAIASPAATRERPPELTPSTERTQVYEAGGFLGLRDVPVCDDKPDRPKKWWQKLLD